MWSGPHYQMLWWNAFVASSHYFTPKRPSALKQDNRSLVRAAGTLVQCIHDFRLSVDRVCCLRFISTYQESLYNKPTGKEPKMGEHFIFNLFIFCKPIDYLIDLVILEVFFIFIYTEMSSYHHICQNCKIKLQYLELSTIMYVGQEHGVFTKLAEAWNWFWI